MSRRVPARMKSHTFIYNRLTRNGLLSWNLAVTIFVSLFSTNVQSQLVRQANTTLKLPASLPDHNYSRIQAFPFTFTTPVGIAVAPGDKHSIYVIEKVGRIQKISNLDTTPTKTLFLDITDRVSSTNLEEGLLGLAFHPKYATNGFFYVFYISKTPRKDFLSRFSRLNANAADSHSETVLIAQPDKGPNFNGGDLHFGPDGYLYVSVGAELPRNNESKNTQRIDKDFFSAIMRLDVDRKFENLEPNPHLSIPMDSGIAQYKIPSDNPFIGATHFNGLTVTPAQVRTEFWAVGFRNPWRFSFDPADGRLFVGDVGDRTREEINLIIKGGNYGWDYYEGSKLTPGVNPNDLPPKIDPIQPIYDYDRTGLHSAVMGGIVYRGSKLSELFGQYIFSDVAQRKVWALKQTPTGWIKSDILTSDARACSFGINPQNGDILMIDDQVGKIYRLARASGTEPTLPATLADTGAFADLRTLTPNPGIVGFAPNVTFWSDQAVKTRWFSIPDISKKMTYSKNLNWTFPEGTIWIKHFNLLMDRRDPLSGRRLETRFIVKTADGNYGLTYRWNASQSNATLVEEDGFEEDFQIIDENGVSRIQHWRYPSRAECRTCHTDVAGQSLGFNTRQLNGDYTYDSFTTNQLTALKMAGYFSNPIPNPSTLPAYANATDESQSLEWRFRSYVAVNCSQCHQPGGPTPAQWDARAIRPLSVVKIVNGALVDNGNNSRNKVVVPGSVNNSVLFHRISNTGGFARMPPLATFELDQKGINLVNRWIMNDLKSGMSISINAGGTAIGNFANDTGFSGGTISTTGSTIHIAGVPNAAPEAVYQTQRRGNTTYVLKGLTPGRDYLLTLHFAEIQFAEAGKRVFDVKVNDKLVVEHLDVFAAAGGKNKALAKQFILNSDTYGKLSIQTLGVTGIPEICGIQLSEHRNSLIAINSGAGAVGGFIADEGFYQNATSTGYSGANINITGVIDTACVDVYRSWRNAPTYTFTGLQSGKNYPIILHFVETAFQESGKRVFNVKINDQTSIANLDIFAETGAINKALVKTVTASANSSGQITVQFINQVDTARVCGIEIRDKD